MESFQLNCMYSLQHINKQRTVSCLLLESCLVTHAFAFLSVESEGAAEVDTWYQRERRRCSRPGDCQGPAPEHYGQWQYAYLNILKLLSSLIRDALMCMLTCSNKRIWYKVILELWCLFLLLWESRLHIWSLKVFKWSSSLVYFLT